MEPTPGSSSGDLSDAFSGLAKKLGKQGTKFIQQFDIKEPRMREIVEELRRICEEVKKMQKKTDDVRAGGAAALTAAGVGVLVGILAAPFTGGASLAAAGGGAAGVAGGALVGGANVFKTSSETDSVKAVETMGKEFTRIVEPLKKTLEEIKETCEEKTAEDQSGNTLTNMEEVEENLKQAFELKVQIEKAHLAAESWIQMREQQLPHIVEVFRLTPASEQDQQLRASILQLADQGQKVIDESEKMQKHLKEILRRGQN